MLLDERTHPHVAEPEVVPGYARAPLLDAWDVEIAAAAAAGDRALPWVGMAEAWVIGLEVGWRRRYRENFDVIYSRLPTLHML